MKKKDINLARLSDEAVQWLKDGFEAECQIKNDNFHGKLDGVVIDGRTTPASIRKMTSRERAKRERELAESLKYLHEDSDPRVDQPTQKEQQSPRADYLSEFGNGDTANHEDMAIYKATQVFGVIIVIAFVVFVIASL